ncbi:MAG: tRNA (adenosine(37)-N6)-threonylcarbamoyltransferase complex ATPase subunit type 1 TsaE [Saprospiraceae bacterium]|nr:tRNA (adenosine(37)-N6)-threonylcarbamoyltransferase complex ATPase subunit type 1 TsaE [Saprospiraceae bacterium]
MKEFLVHTEAGLEEVVQYLLPTLEDRPVITLKGDLGTGKTTLVRAICRQLEVIDDVSSPTFSIINTYLTTSQQVIHHIDLYRLESAEELVQIGIDDYLHSEDLTFIEWPELIESILPINTVRVELQHIDGLARKIVIL